MKLLNKKGMTLFELLAVIVILGIIAAIAYPTVSGIIENSRQNAFASSVNNFVSAAKLDAQAEATSSQASVDIYYQLLDTGVVQTSEDGGTTYVDSTGFGSMPKGITGIIEVKVDENGDVQSITTITNFFNGSYSTNFKSTDDLNNVVFNKDIVDKSDTVVAVS